MSGAIATDSIEDTVMGDSQSSSTLPALVEAQVIRPDEEELKATCIQVVKGPNRVHKLYTENRMRSLATLLCVAVGNSVGLFYLSRLIKECRWESTLKKKARFEAMRIEATRHLKDFISTEDVIFENALAFVASDHEMSILSPNFIQRFSAAHFYFSTSMYGGKWTVQAAHFVDGEVLTVEGAKPVPLHALNDEHECTWEGFVCDDKTKEVTGFDSLLKVKGGLRSQSNVIQMDGVFSEALFALPQFQFLRLHRSNVHGQLPAKAVKALNLRVLDLEENHFTGEIPVEWSHSFRSIRNLNIANNPVTGPLIVPGQNGGQCELLALDVSGTGIGGSIPNALGKCASSLNQFFASFTELQGTLPESMGNLTRIETFALDHTLVEGDASSIVMLPRLHTLYLQETGLSGNFEDRPKSASPILRCNIARSEFKGKIPEFVCAGVFIADCEIDCPCCRKCCNENGCIDVIPP